MSFISPRARGHTVELRTPKIIGITLNGVVEVERWKYTVIYRINESKVYDFITNTNIVDGSAERVDKERPLFLLCGILADIEISSAMCDVGATHATCTDALAV